MARQPLGRGLSALLGDESPKDGTMELGLDQIEPNSEQPRTRFADQALDELAQSIRANGIVQPVVVRRKGEKYQIIAGERRWRAAQRAGLHKIPVVIKEVSDEKLLELALVENIQREELNAVEEARAYRKLIDTIGLTQEMVAERVGKERSVISTSLRLLKLSDEVLQFLEEGKITAGHGRALLMSDDPATQWRLARTIVESSLSVRATEKLVNRSGWDDKQVTDNKVVMASKDPNVVSAETKLRRKLGTNVTIVPAKNGEGGKVEIEYYNEEDLNRIYQMMILSRA